MPVHHVEFPRAILSSLPEILEREVAGAEIIERGSLIECRRDGHRCRISRPLAWNTAERPRGALTCRRTPPVAPAYAQLAADVATVLAAHGCRVALLESLQQCATCGYQLEAREGGTCPECGTVAPALHERAEFSAHVLFPSRFILIAALLATAGVYSILFFGRAFPGAILVFFGSMMVTPMVFVTALIDLVRHRGRDLEALGAAVLAAAGLVGLVVLLGP